MTRAGVALPFGSRKALALLSYLAVEGPQARDRLAGLLWPDSEQAIARGNLRRELHALRGLLGPEAITAHDDTLQLTPGVLEVDLIAFRAGCPELYTGDFMSGFSLPESEDFETWLRERRAEFQQDCKQALDDLVESLEPMAAVAVARRRLTLDSLDEMGHRGLIAALIRSGQRSAATRALEECDRVLRDELGVQSAPETRRLLSAEVAVTRYTARDGVHLAYQVLGERRPGIPDLVFLNGFVSHLELAWEEPRLASFLRRLAEMTRVVLFDKRGVGLSDRVASAPTLEETMDDLLAVMDAAEVARGVLFGVSEGGPVSALAAATHPNRVQGLILYGTMACGSRTPDHPWALTAEQHAAWHKVLVEQWGGPVNLKYFAPSLCQDPAFRDWWARYLRSASTPGGVQAVLEVLRQIDVRELLDSVAVPTVVMHRRDDRAILVGAGRHLAERIPGARFVELAGPDHWWWVGDQAPILEEVEAFLSRALPGPEPESVLATVVALDEPVPEMARARVLPGGLSVLFDGPSRALQFALSRARAGRRVGVHAGECALGSAALDSMAVRVAQELAGQAQLGEALVTGTVRELVIGTPLEFVARGERSLAGVDGWRVLSLV